MNLNLNERSDNVLDFFQFLEKETRDKILSPYKKVLKWIDDTKNATRPPFDEFHATLFAVAEKLQSKK